MEDERIQVAMKIILHAGDARAACTEALNAVAQFDFELAREKMKVATTEITSAHQAQTTEIQNEAAGEKESVYSLLFTHAQDTLMTVMSEINITKQIIKISSGVDERLKRLEEK